MQQSAEQPLAETIHKDEAKTDPRQRREECERNRPAGRLPDYRRHQQQLVVLSPSVPRRGKASSSERPIIFFMRQGTCWQPEVKGLTLMENSIFNSWRMEDVWLDK
jgi:peptide/nickel transport system substrate-binding protein